MMISKFKSNTWLLSIGIGKGTSYDEFKFHFWINYGYKSVLIHFMKNYSRITGKAKS